MRWLHIDKITQLEKGKSARAVKNVSIGEDYITDHFPTYPVMPNSLLIEALAQTGGILLGYTLDFKEKIILAKIEHAVFHELICAGDQVVLDAEIDELREEGARIMGTAKVNDKEVARVSIMFVCLKTDPGMNIPEDNFVFTWEFLSLLKLHEVVSLDMLRK
ncbi:MAG: 3-hydroxyacyl-ACP dehydratase FabZ family protein [Candidatus Ancaeobacter aquaticus]|nr:3-hydroxyacyl-ACP dehydratase FabZ family protein [Candidatus Ancaeobacter aquaticus]